MNTEERLSQLKHYLAELRTASPQFADDAVFVLWFLKAFITDDDDQARKAIVGAARDKGIDAVFVDHKAEVVFIVQGKYRTRLAHHSEKRSDVLEFARLGRIIDGDDAGFADYCERLDPLVQTKIEMARKSVVKRGYRIHLCYVTLGKCSAALVEEAQRALRPSKISEFSMFDGRAVLDLMQRYVDGIAPAVPDLDLQIQAGEPHSPSLFSRSDSDNGIASWVFTMSGEDVGALFRKADVRIFAKNIRGYLGGDTEINKGMRFTLSREPFYFWYFNNGVTIICDDAELTGRVGSQLLRVTNPQIINGQQTTRTLEQAGKSASRASVLVRVIRIPTELANPEKIVSRIVQSTNWQNRISPSDLMSNDRQQIILERELRKRGYQYLRKRMTKREARRAAGGQESIQLTKFDLAQAVAGCLEESLPLRVGKEPLFENETYRRIFRTSDPNYYLTRYWLTQRIKHIARSSGEKKFGRWMVQFFMWSDIGRALDANARKFEHVSERAKQNEQVMRYLDSAIAAALASAWDFYRQTVRKLPERVAPKPFFQREKVGDRRAYAMFTAHWRMTGNKHRAKYRSAAYKFTQALRTVEI